MLLIRSPGSAGHAFRSDTLKRDRFSWKRFMFIQDAPALVSGDSISFDPGLAVADGMLIRQLKSLNKHFSTLTRTTSKD